MSKIKSVEAREIMDSRGRPTIETTCELISGAAGTASVPSGKSTGSHEAVELRDHDPKRFDGFGVSKAIDNVNTEISKNVCGKEFDQAKLDKLLIDLDATKNKSRLGTNAILSVSLAFARGAANEQGVQLYKYLGGLIGDKTFSLPQPMLNIINGGQHSKNGLEIQEFMIIPVAFDSFRLKIQAAKKIIAALRDLLQKNGQPANLGDEGGFAPRLPSNESAIQMLEKAIVAAGFSLNEVGIGIDAAASNFYDNGIYRLKTGGKASDKADSETASSANFSSLNNHELANWYVKLTEKYPLVLIEDGMAENDFDGFAYLTDKLGGKIKIVGDDLTVTNTQKIKLAGKKNAINAVIIKPNQIGTLSETIDAIKETKKHGWSPVASHRSGETLDAFIADLAVGLSCDFIKAGALSQKERVCKYERLIEIEKLV